MPDTPITLRLEVPKNRIEADLVGLIRHLSEAAVQGILLQNWPNAIGNLWRAAETLTFKRSEGSLAWELLLNGIGEALTELANEQPPTLINDSDVNTICERVKKETGDLSIPVDFLNHPCTLQPIVLAKKTMLRWLAPPEGSSIPQDLINLEHRFDSALVLGLHRAIRSDKARYQPLLALQDDPTAPAWQVLEDWRLYRAWLVAEFRTVPVFDESFATDQIYVPLNAWHWEQQDSNEQKKPKKVRSTVNLNNDMLAWLRGEHGDNRLRLISGGPGSGKSSAMKALAATLIEEGNNGCPTDVLLFPLQRFHWRAGIVESVGATLNAADQMRHNPLDPNHLRERQKSLLLIFDGLDELTASTQVSEAISATFLRELTTTLRNWHDRPVRVIVTGRDAIFGNVEGPTSVLPGMQFHLLPYHVRPRNNYDDPHGLLKVDNRKEAFRRFAKAKGQLSHDLPKIYKNHNLHDVSAQPLLNYFMLTSEPDEIADGNLARIYSRLFQRLHDRNRNIQDPRHDKGTKPAVDLDQDSFDRVFETMAVAAWRTGGTRAANWDEVLAEAEREDSYLAPSESKSRLGPLFDTQMHDRGAQKPFRLAAAFFTRNEQATGVEFTHKSFGDYLYARRLAKAIASMAQELSQSLATEEGMLKRWDALTSQQRMSNEIRRFLELEIEATVDAETLLKHHEVLTPVVERVFREGRQAGLEMHQSQRRAEQCSCHMEEALFIAWHAMWRPSQNRRYWILGEKTGDLLYRALARQASAYGMRHDSVFIAAWSGANLSGVDLDGLDLTGADLGRANLKGANLQRATLCEANLVGADLSGSRLFGADFEEADLEKANLSAANLCSASFVDAFLRSADLRGAILTHADLQYADLTRADLRKADLSYANLSYANLSYANLRNTTLENAYLEDAQGLPEGHVTYT